MRALVTGAGGFIGRHLVARLLVEDFEVRTLVRGPGRPPAAEPDGRVELAHGDVRDPVAMRRAVAGIDLIFHLAARVHVMDGRELDPESDEVNAKGTATVLEAAVDAGVRGIVYFSSVKAVGEWTEGCIDETLPAQPTTPYGRSKLAAEGLVLEAGKRHGLHAACLRLPMVYGEGHKGNLRRMLASIDRGLFPPLPELGNRRSVLHVGNAVAAALLAATGEAARGQSYFVTDARAYSTRELYELLARALGRAIPSWTVPLKVLRAIAHGGDLLRRLGLDRFPFDSQALEKLTATAWYSTGRIERELGYRPALTLEAALAELVDDYRRGRR